jgi:TRAP-type transport system periplasmic protein
MQRFTLITLLSLLLALSQSAQAVTFKIATLAPEGTRWMNEMRAGAEEIEKQSEGRVNFRFFPGGTMGNDKSVLRKIHVGQLHGGALTAGALSDIAGDSQIYTLPLTFRNLQEVDYVRGKMDPLIYNALYENGFISFGLSEVGFAYLMSNNPLQKKEALKGQKVWAPEGDKVSRIGFESVGVSPIPLSLSDVLTGLQTGLVDTVATSAVGAIALQWHTQVKYLTEMPLMYLYGTMVIERKKFEKLSEQDQKIVQDIMSSIVKKLNRQNREDNLEAYDALKKQGINVVNVNKDDLLEWEKITAKAMETLVTEGAIKAETLQALRQHISDYRQQK